MNSEDSNINLWLKTQNSIEKFTQKRRKAINPPLQFQAIYKSSSDYRIFCQRYLNDKHKAPPIDSGLDAISWDVKITVLKESAVDSPKINTPDDSYLKKFFKDLKLIPQPNNAKEGSDPIQSPMIMWGSLSATEKQETPINFGPRRYKDG